MPQITKNGNSAICDGCDHKKMVKGRDGFWRPKCELDGKIASVYRRIDLCRGVNWMAMTMNEINNLRCRDCMEKDATVVDMEQTNGDEDSVCVECPRCHNGGWIQVVSWTPIGPKLIFFIFQSATDAVTNGSADQRGFQRSAQSARLLFISGISQNIKQRTDKTMNENNPDCSSCHHARGFQKWGPDVCCRFCTGRLSTMPLANPFRNGGYKKIKNRYEPLKESQNTQSNESEECQKWNRKHVCIVAWPRN